MGSQQKLFRIEMTDAALRADRRSSPAAADRYQEMIDELRALRALVQPAGSISAQSAELRQLRAELNLIYESINQTKQELASLHVAGFESPHMSRMSNELDAVIDGTAQATDQILDAVEQIEDSTVKLGGLVDDAAHRGLAEDIQDRVIKIYEACNFQDIAGQRITKVVNTLKFIETHVLRMMEIWGGIDSFKMRATDAKPKHQGDAALLNGPKLKGDVGHASQDDIDALFP